MSNKNIVLKEDLYINILGIILLNFFYLIFMCGPVLMIINATNDYSVSPYNLYIVSSILIFVLSVAYFIIIAYFIIKIKYYNINFCNEWIYIKYGKKWITKILYKDIIEYGDGHFLGCFLKVKSWNHYKRGKLDQSRIFIFHIKRKEKRVFFDLLSDEDNCEN